MKIGEIRSDLNLEERSQFILSTWNAIDNKKLNDENLISKIHTVRNALNNWPQVRTAIKQFFENDPQRFGLKTTVKFENIKKKFFNSENSLIKTIDRFVDEFDNIARQSNEIRFKRLKEFWKAGDKIHNIITEMQYSESENSRFSDFFMWRND